MKKANLLSKCITMAVGQASERMGTYYNLTYNLLEQLPRTDACDNYTIMVCMNHCLSLTYRPSTSMYACSLGDRAWIQLFMPVLNWIPLRPHTKLSSSIKGAKAGQCLGMRRLLMHVLDYSFPDLLGSSSKDYIVYIYYIVYSMPYERS